MSRHSGKCRRDSEIALASACPGYRSGPAGSPTNRTALVTSSGDHQFVFLLAEQTLRTRIGTAEVMIEQLDRVLGVMALTNVSIGIIPASAGLGAHTQTAFWIFDNDLVKVETLTAALDITRPDEIEIYVTAFDQMQQAARYGRSAKSLILKARDELLQ